MIRLFAALDFPPEIRDRLAALGGGVPGARWIEPDGLHLTLCFAGDVPEDQGADLMEALDEVRVPPFSLTLDGVGVFGSERNARILWAGVERSEALLLLQGRVEAAAARSGVPVENRKFVPHVTLARLTRAPGDRVGRFVEERGLFHAGPFAVERFVLYQSLLGKGGSVYHPLRFYPLTG
jgi:RNA 2',3'-cyclic 3'-phosphodiesterase